MTPTLQKRLRSTLLFWAAFSILANILADGSQSATVVIGCVAGCLWAAVRLERRVVLAGAASLAASSVLLGTMAGVGVAAAMAYIVQHRAAASKR